MGGQNYAHSRIYATHKPWSDWRSIILLSLSLMARQSKPGFPKLRLWTRYVSAENWSILHKELLSRVTRIRWLFFLLSISQIWSAQPGPMRTQEIRAPMQADWLKTNHCVLIGPGWASQVWEMLKRKNSHLIMVILDNTSLWIINTFSQSNLEIAQLIFIPCRKFAKIILKTKLLYNCLKDFILFTCTELYPVFEFTQISWYHNVLAHK